MSFTPFVCRSFSAKTRGFPTKAGVAFSAAASRLGPGVHAAHAARSITASARRFQLEALQRSNIIASSYASLGKRIRRVPFPISGSSPQSGNTASSACEVPALQPIRGGECFRRRYRVPYRGSAKFQPPSRAAQSSKSRSVRPSR